MSRFSVVIICRNEAAMIGRTLQSLHGITDDILVYDNGSTDTTMDIARQFNANLIEGKWEGFGKTKQRAIEHAKHDWILNLDADEAIDDQLKQSLQKWTPGDQKEVYDLQFKNFLGDKHLRYGEWGGDHHVRFFNRKLVNYDDAQVHEKLVIPPGVIVKKLKGYILHQTMKDIEEYSHKMVKYAILNAEKYYQQGKKSSWVITRLSPAFTFFKYYILKLGFLDGHEGYVCAKMTAWYTFLKYARLRELRQKKN
jgi:glycosyltransferase involved in cell wall biosynthesis